MFRPGCIPIVSVKLIGHADTDLEKGHAFERDISIERAGKVEAYLRHAIKGLSKDFKAAPNAPVPRDIKWQPEGVGATQAAPENVGQNPNTLSDQARALNRRVEVILEPQMPKQPDTPWVFDPTDAQKKLQKTLDDLFAKRLRITPPPQPPPPPPKPPDWFWKNLPKLDDKPAWVKWRQAVKDWCEDHPVILEHLGLDRREDRQPRPPAARAPPPAGPDPFEAAAPA